jgi:hypothetical protein
VIVTWVLVKVKTGARKNSRRTDEKESVERSEGRIIFAGKRAYFARRFPGFSRSSF